MANKEISAFETTTTVGLGDWFHIKQGTTDRKVNITSMLADYRAELNPNSVTKNTIGLGNVTNDIQLKRDSNLSDITNKPNARNSLEVYSRDESDANLLAHTSRTDNPANVTKAQVGLGSVPNWSTTNSPRQGGSRFARGTDLATLAAELDTLGGVAVQSGMMMFWDKSKGPIPAGWVECNGTNGTPDMREKFPLCSTYANSGATGGTNDNNHGHAAAASPTALTPAQIPEHYHISGAAYNSGPFGTSSISQSGRATGSQASVLSPKTSSVGGGLPHDHTVSVDDVILDNRPAYRKLVMIMKV